MEDFVLLFLLFVKYCLQLLERLELFFFNHEVAHVNHFFHVFSFAILYSAYIFLIGCLNVTNI